MGTPASGYGSSSYGGMGSGGYGASPYAGGGYGGYGGYGGGGGGGGYAGGGYGGYGMSPFMGGMGRGGMGYGGMGPGGYPMAYGGRMMAPQMTQMAQTAPAGADASSPMFNYQGTPNAAQPTPGQQPGDLGSLVSASDMFAGGAGQQDAQIDPQTGLPWANRGVRALGP